MTELESGPIARADGEVPSPSHVTVAATAAVAASALLGACGGGGEDGAPSSTTADTGPGSSTEAVRAPARPSERQAARFLSQAAMGITREEIASVRSLGYEGWLDRQFAMPQQQSRWDWLLAAGYGAENYKNSGTGFDPAMWRKLIASPDTLRQRVTLALSEILVVSIEGLPGANWRTFAAAAYFDLLEANAFGNFRELMQQLSRNPAMGTYLTFRNSVKADPVKGSQPDENYARELLQLFTIGLLELNPDGSLKLANGQPKETYTQADVSGLARVFTGWEWNKTELVTPQEFQRTRLALNSGRHESGAKVFLGTTIPAGTDGEASLTMALDTICGHPNVAPFIGRQLIQRLVTSNPSEGYVARVSAAFNGNGVRGDLRAVLKAILLDNEARSDTNLANPAFGKLREPLLRFTGWARVFKVASPNDAWTIPNSSEPGTRLAQAAGRSPSVFNFFRPGYVPPNTAIANAGLEAPEFQITNESSVVGYINYMQTAVNGSSAMTPDYSAVLPLVPDSEALLAELNLLLAAGQLSSATLKSLKTALDTMSTRTNTGKNNRLYAALVLVLAAPEFIVLK